MEGSPEPTTSRPSLFVVGLPRSLTSRVFGLAAGALGLRRPAWTAAGEILNLDRLVMYAGPAHDESHKYTVPEKQPRRAARITAFLDDVVHPTGHAYKDVVQPFVVADWLRAHPMRTLVVRRPVGDVAWAMSLSRWYYPGTASWVAEHRDDAVIEGLVRADAALGAVAGEVLAFDDLVRDERHLADALGRLYPEVEVTVPRYRDEQFFHESRRQLARRALPPYKELVGRIEAMRHLVAEAGPAPPGIEAQRPLGRAKTESIRRFACEVLPQDATVAVVDRGLPTLTHLEGRRALAVRSAPGQLVAALDLAVARGADHVVLACPEISDLGWDGPAPDVLLDATLLGEDPWVRVYALPERAADPSSRHGASP